MNTVDESLNHLIEAVRNSKEFQDYQIVKAKVEKYPEKKRSLDKYRTRMYKIQNNHGETDLYHHIDEIERESERFRQDALIDEFLTAELAPTTTAIRMQIRNVFKNITRNRLCAIDCWEAKFFSFFDVRFFP